MLSFFSIRTEWIREEQKLRTGEPVCPSLGVISAITRQQTSCWGSVNCLFLILATIIYVSFHHISGLFLPYCNCSKVVFVAVCACVRRHCYLQDTAYDIWHLIPPIRLLRNGGVCTRTKALLSWFQIHCGVRSLVSHLIYQWVTFRIWLTRRAWIIPERHSL